MTINMFCVSPLSLSLSLQCATMTLEQNNHTITHIPVIDLGGMNTNLEETANQVLEAATQVGFFFVRIPPEQKEYLQMFDTAKEFFKLPVEEKLKYKHDMETNVGYSAIRHEMVDVTSTRRDYKESYNIGRLVNGESKHAIAPTFADKIDLVRQFQNQCDSIAVDIMECMAIALKIPDEKGGRSYFSRQYLQETQPCDIIRTLHYPIAENDNPTDLKEEVRIGRHSDYGLITLLWQNKIGGLQIQSNSEPKDPSKMTWLDVPVRDDCVVVNMGDCLQYWTNGLIRSTKHRVIFQPGLEQQQERYSIAYFVQGGGMALDPVPSLLIPSQPSYTDMAQEEPNQFKTSKDYLQHRIALTYTAY
ncbi:hypothetical protein BC941DRAFT_415536 [Chlamydoabsidia padenii]|nr:hypothetical protein BC941DRAFT_415536 [Chlamydoabsidia padenii]